MGGLLMGGMGAVYASPLAFPPHKPSRVASLSMKTRSLRLKLGRSSSFSHVICAVYHGERLMHHTV